MALFLKHILRSEFRVRQFNIIRLASTNPQLKMLETKILPPVVKSPLDTREYRGLELPNQMKAILISDSKTDKSAASISIAAGSMNDPKHLPGLAHFCEHMLFLGTEKYPAENDYSKFLGEHGGSSNAYTARDHTNYYFDVSPQSLVPALDKFSQFFISPLFTESATEREVNAVNSEHDKNLSSDLWRINQLQCSLAKPDHPFSYFATGSRETLWTEPRKKNIDVRSSLLDYHKEFYSSNMMNLTVLGTESLDELQKIVESMFSNIENRNVEMPRWVENPFGLEQLQTRVDIVPIKDVRHLSIQFSIPDVSRFYKTGSDQYISHLIGHEGPGSLLSLLKKLNWVNNLSAGAQVPARGFAIFKVSVDLTPEGLEHTEDITTIIFQYLNLLRESGVQKWIWDELRDLSALFFRYKDKEHPQNLVSQVSSSLHEVPAEDVLSAGFLLSEYNPDLIKTILEHLTPKECLIMTSSKSYEEKANLTEQWYGVKYYQEKIQDENVKKWTNCGLHPELKLPKQNQFIPTVFDLKPREEKGIIPRVISDTGLSTIWFLQDNEFLMPKAMARVELYSSLPLLDPKHTNLNSMFVMVMKDLLTEEAYAADAAGLHYGISASPYGFEVFVSGYDDKLDVLMRKVIETIASFSCTQARFDVLKDSYSRLLKNFYDEQPYSHAVYYLGYLLREKRWLHQELIDTIDAITLENLERYSKDFLEKLKMEWLIYGNLIPPEAESLVEICESYLKEKGTQPLSSSQVIRLRELKLPSGSNHIYKSTHSTHQSSCAAIFYQAGFLNMRDSLVLELVDHIANEPCFTQLRTQEQLGYIVFSGIRRSGGIEGIQLLVQSDRHPGYVDSRIENFLASLDEILNKMPQEEFLQQRNGLAVRKSEKPKKLKDRGSLIWGEISTQQYIFDRQRLELLELEKVTLQDVQMSFSTILKALSPKRKRIGVHVLSTAVGGAGTKILDEDKPIIEEVEKKATVIVDAHSWKQTMELYPCVHPWSAKAKL